MAYRATHRTTLVLDRRKLTKVRSILRTKPVKDTIDAALDAVIAFEARRHVVEQMCYSEGFDLDNPEVMAKAWE